MNMFILFLDIAAAAVLFAECVVAFRSSGKSQIRIDRYYASLLASYGIWLLLHTFILFSDLLADHLPSEVLLLSRGLKTLATAMIINLYLKIALGRVRLRRVRRLGHKMINIIITMVLASYFAMIGILFFSMSAAIASIISISFSITMLTVSIMGYASSGYRSDSRMRRLFMITGTYSLILIILSFPAVLSADPLITQALPRALFCGAVGLSEIINLLRKDREIPTEESPVRSSVEPRS